MSDPSEKKQGVPAEEDISSMSGCPFAHTALPAGDMANRLRTKRPREEDEPPSLLGFATPEASFIHGEKPAPTHYGTYLGIPQLLSLQDGAAECKPGGKGLMHHEELTFVIIHQVFELWFKLAIADLTVGRQLLLGIEKASADERQHRLTSVTQFLRRTEAIFHHVVGAFGLMETMHPADFIEFRDYLIPASGFQSVQFRQMEQLFGVQRLARSKVNGREVFEYLHVDEQAMLEKQAKEVPSLNEIVETLLAKVYVPENFKKVYYEVTEKVLCEQQYGIAKCDRGDKVAAAHIKHGMESMQSMLETPIEWSEGLLVQTEEQAQRYKDAVLAALFVTSYRHEARYSQLAAFLDLLVAVEQAMLLWRGRHMHMAERMIGRRAGTGGTGSGVGYLDVTRRYRIFHCLWLVRKLFVRASALPPLSTFNVPENIFQQ